VDVGIHLGTTVLQQVPEMTEYFIHDHGVSSSDGARGGDERFALSARVLVEDENGKNVAEEKARGNQSDATEDVEAASAHGCEIGRETGTLREWSGNRWH
jgi:hypothetical protein